MKRRVLGGVGLSAAEYSSSEVMGFSPEGHLVKSSPTFFLAILAAVQFPILAAAQARPFPGPDVQQIYQRLLPQIEKIPAFDHHAHPGFADDPDVDAMAAPPNASEAFRTRDDNLELVAAAKAL
ncbi:MAG TPA: hypothetical protein VI386_33925, partial [Candidatus Sulfotelmatobacter sp.]